jgi:hypothetical protein
VRWLQWAASQTSWRATRQPAYRVAWWAQNFVVPSQRTLLLHGCWPGMGSLLYRLLVQVDISVKAGLALVVLGFARSLLGVSAAVMSLRNPRSHRPLGWPRVA